MSGQSSKIKISFFYGVPLIFHWLDSILWRTLLWWNMLNLHWCSLKIDCTNEFCIPKLSENSPFQVSNSTHNDRNNYQVILTFIANPGTHWRTLLWWNMMDLHLFSLKTDCTNKFSIPKLSENSSFQVSNSTHDDRNNYQVTLLL